jgi:IMP dehydrogenase
MLEETLTFDDVLIEPNYSDIVTRSHIDLSQNDFLGLRLFLPIISANMDYVTDWLMSMHMWHNGGLGILHRFKPWDEQVKSIQSSNATKTPVFISVGTRDRAEALHHISTMFDYLNGVCVDIAHGHHEQARYLIQDIKAFNPDLWVIAGNIATEDGFRYLADAGADAIKVGIGPGSVCTTREVTGVGVPQFTAIQRAVNVQQDYPDVKIIADGGIKNSGDIVKALAIGADVVMLGSLLAGADECPGEVRVAPDNSRWRPYRGQSIFGTNGSKYTPEGIEGWVKEKGPVEDILKQLAGGIRSGMSYVGARNLDELRAKARFIRVSPYASLESGTRVQQEL